VGANDRVRASGTVHGDERAQRWVRVPAVDVNREQWQPLASATETGTQGRAPRAVLLALAGLLRGRESRAVCATVDVTESATRWQVAALTESDIIVVEGSRQVTSWSLGFRDNPGRDQIDLTGWTAPTSVLTRVTLVDFYDLTDHSFTPTEWAGSGVYKIELGTASFTLPISGRLGSHAEGERVDAFATALLNRSS
jgi:hypothetical protein